ncbi:hypothetical protein [Maricaulis sp. CAU 1757]
MIGSFLVALIVTVLIAAAFALRWWLARRRLRADARAEYEERCQSKPGTVRGVDRAAFETLYIGAYEPRWALYVAFALLAAIAVTPVAAIILVLLWPLLILPLDGGPWYEPGYYPWMFYMFFGFCAIWAVTGAIVARIHHARSPEPFNPALARARGEPLDNVVIPRKRPEWAKKARPEWAKKARPDPKPGTPEQEGETN